jgi:hypothetical protein
MHLSPAALGAGTGVLRALLFGVAVRELRPWLH